ncbi:hypothetical protein SIPHO049v1_p0022 [Vibrio phage PS14A.1]|nr:hypothetical protein SIPHO049v1_p0022 [Vibrio phage PS14A.1]
MSNKDVEFIGIYDDPQPREFFLQHIPEMLYVSFTGNTFGDLEKAIEEKYKDNEELLPLFKDFIAFNKEEGGATDDAELFEGDKDSKSVAHFSLYNK